MHIDGVWFKDEQGRTLILRGANLGGSTKVPYSPNGATYVREGFFDHRNVSFVGRPFPLQEADEHLARLRAWGMTFLRFLITWEAVEHAGPGQYDQDYLDYVYAVVEKAGDYGIDVFIDPHQDVMHFDPSARTFEFEFRHDPEVTAPTEIFVPDYQYPEGYKVELSDGTLKIDHDALTLTVHHTLDRETRTVRIHPRV